MFVEEGKMKVQGNFVRVETVTYYDYTTNSFVEDIINSSGGGALFWIVNVVDAGGN